MAAVTDKQVTTLRAQLAGDIGEHRRLLDELDPDHDSAGYEALVLAAFVCAANRRFGNEPKRSAVIEFVGSLRSRSSGIAEELDPDVGERMIMAALTDESIEDLDSLTRLRATMVMTAALLGEEQLAGTELDAFMAEAREMAEKLTG